MQSLDGILYTFPSTFKLLSTASIYSSVRKTLYCQALRVSKRLNTSETTSWFGTLSHLSKWKLGKYNCKNIPSFLTHSRRRSFHDHVFVFPNLRANKPARSDFILLCFSRMQQICAQDAGNDVLYSTIFQHFPEKHGRDPLKACAIRAHVARPNQHCSIGFVKK